MNAWPEPQFSAALLLAAGTTGLCSFWLACRRLSIPAAGTLVFIRFLIPIVYFGFFWDGSWNILDDLTYWRQGQQLSAAGYDPLSVFYDPNGWTLISMLSEGTHVLYGWWNLLSQTFFGPWYFAPVFMNIALTFVCGEFLYRLAQQDGFTDRYCKALLVLFLLQYEILAWTSLLNIKDTLVMTLTLLLLHGYGGLARGITLRRVAWIGAVSFAMLWLRGYLILLAFGAAAVWYGLGAKGWRRWALIALAPVGMLGVVSLFGSARLQGGLALLQPTALLTGVPRFLLTPQPWSIDPDYSYLTLPMILHWLLFPALLAGLLMLWNRSRVSALMLIYAAMVIGVYASYPDLQGPRHRIQLIPILCWAQFHCLWALTHSRAATYVHAQPAQVADAEPEARPARA